MFQQRDREPSPAIRSHKALLHSEYGESSDSSRGKGKRKRGIHPTLPPPDKPGVLGDPYRTGLSGAGMKCYLRYLEEGKTPEAARQLVERRPKSVLDLPGGTDSQAEPILLQGRQEKNGTCTRPRTGSGKQTADPVLAEKRGAGTWC